MIEKLRIQNHFTKVTAIIRTDSVLMSCLANLHPYVFLQSSNLIAENAEIKIQVFTRNKRFNIEFSIINLFCKKSRIQNGVHFVTENELNLFGDVSGKKLLEICCGSGHSLKYHADRNAVSDHSLRHCLSAFINELISRAVFEHVIHKLLRLLSTEIKNLGSI